MIRKHTAAVALLTLALPLVAQGSLKGIYLETRTCQVYTGPCFANGDMAITGRDAIMAWKIQEGQMAGDVDLKGLSVVVVVRASGTLGYHGLNSAKQLKSVILVDERANPKQREALITFAKKHTKHPRAKVVRISTSPIEMSLDAPTLKGSLKAGKEVKLVTRKANKDDCICTNETAFYPPLAKVKNFAPGVAIEGQFKGRGLGSRWSTPGARSAYMGLFQYQ